MAFQVSTVVGSTVGALLVAKAVLTVDIRPFMEPFPKIPMLVTHGSLGPVWNNAWSPHFGVIQIWLVVVLLVFSIIREAIGVLGAAKATEISLGSARLRTPDLL
jgi:hypothetical protein